MVSLPDLVKKWREWQQPVLNVHFLPDPVIRIIVYFF